MCSPSRHRACRFELHTSCDDPPVLAGEIGIGAKAHRRFGLERDGLNDRILQAPRAEEQAAELGMTRSEINERFEEIVDFSEIERFLETPIKFYSSGMYMRLAFAVAAHLEPEILMVDEVLAVGDLSLQRKCLKKMRDIREQGRTVIFVSHNMQAVTRLCDRAIWIENGRLKEDGVSREVVSNYLNSRSETSSFREWNRESA